MLGNVEEQPGWFSWALKYPMDSGFVESGIDKTKIHFIRWCPPKPKSEVVSKDSLPASIVLLHGNLAHAYWWHHVGPYLAEDGYEVIAISFSGHGDSEIDHQMESGYDVWPDQVVDVCTSLNLFDAKRLSKPIIVGHSMGGFVAEKVCMNLGGDKLSGLIILDSGIPHFFYWLYEKKENIPLGKKKNRESRIYLVDEYKPVDRLSLAPPQPGVPPYILEHIANTGASTIQNQKQWFWKVDPNHDGKSGFPQWVFDVGTPDNVLKFDTKVAVIFGEESAIVQKSSREYMRYILGEHIPVIGIPGAGHHCLLDQPIACISALRSVFAEWNRSETATGTGKMLPRLSSRATIGANEGGGFDGNVEEMRRRSIQDLKASKVFPIPKKKKSSKL